MLKKILLGLCLSVSTIGPAAANEPFKLMLEWFVNPDHAPIAVAQQIGAFNDVGLDVEVIPPADPNMQPRMVASKQVDLAIYYQNRMPGLVLEGIPAVRVGTLIDGPLTALLGIKGKGVDTLSAMKGKSIGVSVSGINNVIIDTMLKSSGLKSSDATLINVNFQTTTALLSGQVNTIIGLRTFEAAELRAQGAEPVVYNVEDYGVPKYDQFIFITSKDNVGNPKIKKFLEAIKKSVAYLRAHPQETWDKFAADHPDLNNATNKNVWMDTIKYFAADPMKLDTEKYAAFGKYLFDTGEIKKEVPVSDYAVEIK